MHQFLTDKYGFKTTADINNSNLIIIGDSFLAASGGDNMNEQFGSVIGNLISKEVYEAAHPGNIEEYNRRHRFFKKINSDAKFIYLMFEGNDFGNAKSYQKTKPWHHLRKYYVPVFEFPQKLKFLRPPLFTLIKTKFYQKNQGKRYGKGESDVLVSKLDSGRIQAFYKIFVDSTNEDKMIPPDHYSYISANTDSICGIIYVPTAYATYLSKETLEERHPTLYGQFTELQKLGIDFVDLTLPLKEEAKREGKENPIWWSDDTHWNSRGIKLGAETSIKSLECLRKQI